MGTAAAKKKATKKKTSKASKTPARALRGRRTTKSDVIQVAYEGIFLVSYIESNPQGDLNAGGAPRIDPVTGHARLSSTAITRKIRDLMSAEGGNILYLRNEFMTREDGRELTIDDQIQAVREAEGHGVAAKYVKAIGGKAADAGADLDPSESRSVRDAVIETYEDLPHFGALLSVGSDKLDNVRGAVRVQTARSVSPVMPIQDAVTRGMITSEKERSTRSKALGNRTTIPFALFPIPFSIIAVYAQAVHFTDEHLRKFLRGLMYCIPNDQSPTRRGVVHDLWLFQSPNHLIRRPIGSDWLGGVVKIAEKGDDPIAIRSIEDYEITVDTSAIPSGVRMLTLRDLEPVIEDHEAFLKVIGR